jgi:hypothetical protein
MNRQARVISTFLVIFVFSTSTFAQKETEPQPASQKGFGKSYSALLPDQKRLVDDYVRRYNSTAGSQIAPQEAYDGARLSIRTTFEAVTHALVNAKITDENGKSLGRAIDIVEVVDEIMGQEDGAGGDRQFRVYVYLKPETFDILSHSREFYHDRDNTMFHKGFPICFRLKNGPPSIQVSMSRDRRMGDIDVDYRSPKFPQCLVDGHFSAWNSDVRAADNLNRHDGRWQGLDGWWRNVFGFSLDSHGKEPKGGDPRKAGSVPVEPRMKSDQGIDAAVHDFLKEWIVDKQPNNAIAYFSRRSYPCLEAMARQKGKPVQPGMVRVRLKMGMQDFIAATGPATSVTDAFEAAESWSPALKEAKNAYPKEFRLVAVPWSLGQEQECVSPQDEYDPKKHNEKYYAAAIRGTRGDSRNRVLSLLWAEEGHYWKIVAIRLGDSGAAGLTPKKVAATPIPAEAEPLKYPGDPDAVKDITGFYQSWIVKRDTAEAARYVSERSYACLETGPAKPGDRMHAALERPLVRLAAGSELAGLMSGVQPVNELVRPVDHANSAAFAIMAVPEQMAVSFLCQRRNLPEATPDLKPADAKYGAYYTTASQLNYGDEMSPALLLLWTRDQDRWKVVAWAVEVP